MSIKYTVDTEGRERMTLAQTDENSEACRRLCYLRPFLSLAQFFFCIIIIILFSEYGRPVYSYLRYYHPGDQGAVSRVEEMGYYPSKDAESYSKEGRLSEYSIQSTPFIAGSLGTASYYKEKFDAEHCGDLTPIPKGALD